MRLVQEGIIAVTFGLVETLRLGETTTGMPLARVVVEKKRGRKKAVSEKRLTVDMMSLQRLRERMMRGESRRRRALWAAWKHGGG